MIEEYSSANSEIDGLSSKSSVAFSEYFQLLTAIDEKITDVRFYLQLVLVLYKKKG